MDKCFTCGKEGSVFKSQSGRRVCILCIQDELYGRNDWGAHSEVKDPIDEIIERLRKNPIEGLLASRFRESSK
jgi:hypothetical protein